MVYVLDTNAFYYAAGISSFTYNVEKLRKLVAENDTFLSTTSLYEFIIKNRNNLSIIQKGGRFIFDNNIKIASNIFNPLPSNHSLDLQNYSETQLNSLCDVILENKIDIESRYTSFILNFCLFSGFYFYAFPSPQEPSKACFHIFEALYKMLSPMNIEAFKQVFTDGYQTNDCENYVRNYFYNLLEYELVQSIPYIEKAKLVPDDTDTVDISDWLSSDDFENAFKDTAAALHKKTSTQYLQQLGIKYKKGNNDPYLTKHISAISGLVNKRIPYPALQDYYYDTLENIVTNGAALRKNDFLDALIMCNIQNKHILITYDNGVIKRMEKRKEQYPKYQESLDIICELKA